MTEKNFTGATRGIEESLSSTAKNIRLLTDGYAIAELRGIGIAINDEIVVEKTRYIVLSKRIVGNTMWAVLKENASPEFGWNVLNG